MVGFHVLRNQRDEGWTIFGRLARRFTIGRRARARAPRTADRKNAAALELLLLRRSRNIQRKSRRADPLPQLHLAIAISGEREREESDGGSSGGHVEQMVTRAPIGQCISAVIFSTLLKGDTSEQGHVSEEEEASDGADTPRPDRLPPHQRGQDQVPQNHSRRHYTGKVFRQYINLDYLSFFYLFERILEKIYPCPKRTS